MIPFQIVDTAASFPFMTVGHSTDGPIVDTHFFFDLGGDEELHVYLNEREVYNLLMSGVLQRPDYVAGLATRYDMLTSEAADELRERVEAAEARTLEVETELAEWRPLIDRATKASERFARETV